jgi:hypothetical protein
MTEKELITELQNKFSELKEIENKHTIMREDNFGELNLNKMSETDWQNSIRLRNEIESLKLKLNKTT